MTERLLRSYPYVLGGSAVLGLAAANAARVHGLVLVLSVVVASAAGAFAAEPIARVVLIALALLLAGWWWGSARLDALDSSVLLAHVGEAAPSLAVVTGPARQSSFELRVPATMRRFGPLAVDEPILLELPLGRSPPQGAHLQLLARAAASAACLERLRRADVASAARRPRGRGRTGLGGGRSSRWPGRLRRSRPRLACRFACAGAHGRETGGSGGGRPRGGPGSFARAPDELPGVRALPPARRLGAERRLRRCRRPRARVADRAASVARRARGSGRDRVVRARRRSAAVRDPGRNRGLARFARLAVGAAAGPLALPAARCLRPARLEPVQPARCRLPAVVHSGGGDLRRGSPGEAGARGLPAAEGRARGDRGLARLRPRHRADSLAPVRADPDLHRPREPPRGAGGRAASRPLPRRCDRGLDLSAGRRCNRLGKRVARRLSGRLCPPRRRAARVDRVLVERPASPLLRSPRPPSRFSSAAGGVEWRPDYACRACPST